MIALQQRGSNRPMQFGEIEMGGEEMPELATISTVSAPGGGGLASAPEAVKVDGHVQ